MSNKHNDRDTTPSRGIYCCRSSHIHGQKTKAVHSPWTADGGDLAHGGSPKPVSIWTAFRQWGGQRDGQRHGGLAGDGDQGGGGGYGPCLFFLLVWLPSPCHSCSLLTPIAVGSVESRTWLTSLMSPPASQTANVKAIASWPRPSLVLPSSSSLACSGSTNGMPVITQAASQHTAHILTVDHRTKSSGVPSLKITNITPYYTKSYGNILYNISSLVTAVKTRVASREINYRLARYFCHYFIDHHSFLFNITPCAKMSTNTTPEIPSLEEAYPRDVLVQYIITPIADSDFFKYTMNQWSPNQDSDGANPKEQLHVVSNDLWGYLLSYNTFFCIRHENIPVFGLLTSQGLVAFATLIPYSDYLRRKLERQASRKPAEYVWWLEVAFHGESATHGMRFTPLRCLTGAELDNWDHR